ncbi:MAG: MFS transporter [Corynebacterium casei]|nr:MFS transporter [Corynebacterium casei]
MNVWVYLSSAGMSALGNSVAGIVWPWIVLERTGDPAAAGLVAAAVAVPSVLFAFLGGYLIDTVGRKPMSVISDIISGLSVAGVVLVDQTLGLTIAWFIILGIVGGVGDIPGMAARSALVGDIAQSSGKTVDYIAGLNQAIMGVSFLVGPALAGVLLASLESSWVLVITAACSFIAALLTTFLRLSKREMTEAEKAAAAEANALNLKALKSWGQVIRPPSIMMLAILTFVGVALVGPFLGVLMPAHFQNVDQPFLLGLAFSFYAIGMMVSGAGIAAVGTSRRRLVWVVAIGVEAIGFAMMAALGASWLVVIGCGIAGLAGGMLAPLQMVLVTEETPEHMRGRAFSLFTAIMQFGGPIGLVVASGLLTALSIYQLAVVLVAAYMLVAIWAMIRGIQILPTYVATEATTTAVGEVSPESEASS